MINLPVQKSLKADEATKISEIIAEAVIAQRAFLT